MNEKIIETQHLSCKVGHNYLLHDINWTVKRGEHWVIFGMNGSGKTTLLSIISGFRHFTSGKLNIFGHVFTNENILNIRKKIGLVSSSFFEKYYTKESIIDIVLSGKTGSLGLDNNLSFDDYLLTQKLLSELGLSKKLHHTFDMLSKGERQNVLIARALISKPRVLILDEPCTGLDIYNRAYLFEVLNQMALLKDMTIIYVTHYYEEIIPIFDKCLLLKKGHIFAQGKTQELFQEKYINELLEYPITLQVPAPSTRYLRVNHIHPNILMYLY